MRLKKEWIPQGFKGARVILRPIRFDDAETIVALANDPILREKLSFFSFFQNPPTIESEINYLKRMIESETDLMMAMESIETRQFIGTIGLHELDWWNDNCRFGIIIFNKIFWGNGYAKESADLILDFAFSRLEMNKIYLTPRLDNARSIQIYKKLGFKPEGVLRQEYKVKSGQYLNLLRMSILKNEWLESRKNE